MNLLTVLGVCANDSVAAESLLDYIADLSGKKPCGSILIVASPDLHEEFRIKLRIAAEIGFEHVEVLPLAWPAKPPVGKAENINYLFEQAAIHVGKCYRVPFLWLEPDCVPTQADWRERLALSYHSQPKRYLGAFLKDTAANRMALSRVAVYPNDCAQDVKIYCEAKIPFELLAMEALVRCASKTSLIQQIRFDSTTDIAKIRPNAVLVHSDKESVLLAALREKLSAKPEEKPSPFADAPSGQALANAQLNNFVKDLSEVSNKLDGRTKAGRAARQATNA